MRTLNSDGDLWYFLRKKARWNAGRAIVQLKGAEMVRAPLDVAAKPKEAEKPAEAAVPVPTKT
jgi:hypothetical protein